MPQVTSLHSMPDQSKIPEDRSFALAMTPAGPSLFTVIYGEWCCVRNQWLLQRVAPSGEVGRWNSHGTTQWQNKEAPVAWIEGSNSTAARFSGRREGLKVQEYQALYSCPFPRLYRQGLTTPNTVSTGKGAEEPDCSTLTQVSPC